MVGNDIFFEDFTGLVGSYPSGAIMGDWTVVAASDEAVVSLAAAVGVTAWSGDAVFSFASYPANPGFGDNRIDVCVPFDPNLALDFELAIYPEVAEVTDALRLRVNPNFYADLPACEADVAANSTAGRLLGNWANEDWDVRLGSAMAMPEAWTLATESTHGTQVGAMHVPPAQYPELATVVRFSVRLRDDGFAADPTRRIYLDAIRLSQTP
jgi:hypothetical protein